MTFITSISLDDEARENLQALATYEERSQSQIIRRLLRQAVKQGSHGPTESLRDAHNEAKEGDRAT